MFVHVSISLKEMVGPTNKVFTQIRILRVQDRRHPEATKRPKTRFRSSIQDLSVLYLGFSSCVDAHRRAQDFLICLVFRLALRPITAMPSKACSVALAGAGAYAAATAFLAPAAPQVNQE